MKKLEVIQNNDPNIKIGFLVDDVGLLFTPIIGWRVCVIEKTNHDAEPPNLITIKKPIAVGHDELWFDGINEMKFAVIDFSTWHWTIDDGMNGYGKGENSLIERLKSL